MNKVRVQGKNARHKVLMYALSTCVWCKLTKQFLKDSKVEYEYVDVDLCSEEDQDKIHKDIQRRGGRISFPTLIIDDKKVINGFRKDEIKEVLEI